MATVLDLGLLEQFSDIFAWILIFAVLYGVLQITDIFKSRGINALVAISATILLGLTSGTSDVIAGLLPWFVITAIFMAFLLVMIGFLGINLAETPLGGGAGFWWVFVPLIIGIIIALVTGGQFDRDEGEEGSDTSAGKGVINIITSPKVLGFILIMAISAITVAIMATAPKVMS